MAGLRANQRDGLVSEAYAVGSSKVEKINRVAKALWNDPVKYPQLRDLYKEARRYREQARTRMSPLEEIEDELYTPELLDPQELKDLTKQSETLVGEIFIRLYRIDLVTKKARHVLGA